jgi:hypothetical protein
MRESMGNLTQPSANGADDRSTDQIVPHTLYKRLFDAGYQQLRTASARQKKIVRRLGFRTVYVN